MLKILIYPYYFSTLRSVVLLEFEYMLCISMYVHTCVYTICIYGSTYTMCVNMSLMYLVFSDINNN